MLELENLLRRVFYIKVFTYKKHLYYNTQLSAAVLLSVIGRWPASADSVKRLKADRHDVKATTLQA